MEILIAILAVTEQANNITQEVAEKDYSGGDMTQAFKGKYWTYVTLLFFVFF